MSRCVSLTHYYLEYCFIAAVARVGNSSNYYENQQCGLPATEAQSQQGAVTEFLCDQPVLARYVSLDINSSSPGVIEAILQIAELTVDEYTSKECVPNNSKAKTY